jgi:hypothetical protein
MKDAFTFAFIRNPYDRMVSLYHYTRKKRQVDRRFGFKRFCEVAPTIRNVNFSQLFWIFPGVDFVGRYEDLESDFIALCDALEIKRRKLPLMNISENRKPWQEYYTKEIEEIVYKNYREDFECLGYERYNLLH